MLTTSEPRQEAFASTTSKKHNGGNGEAVSLTPLQCSQRFGKRYIVPPLEVERILLMCQAFTSEDNISKAGEIHNVKKTLLHENQTHGQLDMSGWRCAFHDSLCMITGGVSEGSDRIIPNAVPRKIPPNQNQLNHNIMNELNWFLKSGYLIIYNIFSSISPSQGPPSTDNAVLPGQGPMPSYVLSLRALLPKTFTAVADGRNSVMSSASCLDWLQTSLSLQFVASLTIGSPKSFVVPTLNYTSNSEIWCSLSR